MFFFFSCFPDYWTVCQVFCLVSADFSTVYSKIPTVCILF
eukprot:11477.XXX_515480_515599_1 [CDS] Oithona nana genome sequencing.